MTPSELEYIEAIQRLKERRKKHWEAVFSEIPKPVLSRPARPRMTDLPPQKRYSAYVESPMGRAQ